MKKINNDLFYKRISDYAERCYDKSHIVIDWNYTVVGDYLDSLFNRQCKKILLAVTYMSDSGHEFELKSYVAVPYDGRRKARLIDFID